MLFDSYSACLFECQCGNMGIRMKASRAVGIFVRSWKEEGTLEEEEGWMNASDDADTFDTDMLNYLICFFLVRIFHLCGWTEKEK